jgi:hypothetical protein
VPKEIKGGLSQRRTVGDCGKNTQSRRHVPDFAGPPQELVLLELGNVPLILNGEFRGIVRLSWLWVALWQVLVPGIGRRDCRMIVVGELNWWFKRCLGGVIERGSREREFRVQRKAAEGRTRILTWIWGYTGTQRASSTCLPVFPCPVPGISSP